MPTKIKIKSTVEQLNNLKKNVFELTLSSKSLSSKYNIIKSYEEQIDLLLYKNHYCLLTILQNVCGNNVNYKQICRQCLNTHGDRRKIEEQKNTC